VDDIDRLRRLAFNLAADASPPEISLDPRALALVRLGAVVAVGGGSVATYGALADEALDAGASVGDVVDVLLGVLPLVGTARVVAAAPALALALGHDTADMLPQ
jgi:4-carboxymuconolactone decarboxylase